MSVVETPSRAARSCSEANPLQRPWYFVRVGFRIEWWLLCCCCCFCIFLTSATSTTVFLGPKQVKENNVLLLLVMGRAWIFRASGGLGLLCIGPRAGRAFLYRASGGLGLFQSIKCTYIFVICLWNMKFSKLIFLTRPQIRPEIGLKSADFGQFPAKNKLKTFW